MMDKLNENSYKDIKRISSNKLFKFTNLSNPTIKINTLCFRDRIGPHFQDLVSKKNVGT
jgi:hypothetical protein